MKNIEGRGCFSIIDEYLAQAKKHNVRMFRYGDFFMDLGTPEALMKINEMMA